MSVLARAEHESDVSDVAYACAFCFCRARCAGLDITAIAAVAKAALYLGAEEPTLYRDAPPYDTDADYFDELEALRAWLRQIIQRCAKVYEDAYRQAVMARRMLRAARNDTARALALQLLAEATAAMDLAYETAMRCATAGRYLLMAEADFRWVYERTEATVAAGHQLPHRGRWITGETKAPARV